MLGITNEKAAQRIVWFIRRAVIEGAKLAVVFAAIELILHLAAPQYTNQLFDRETTAGHPRAINNEGYRGPALPVEKPSNVQRLLGLGDSVTFGTGIASEQTWPHQTADVLSTTLKQPVEAINAGVPAADLRQLAYAFEHKWLAYDPDCVALVLSNNMISLAWIRRDESPTIPDLMPVKATKPSFVSTTKRRARQMMYRLATPRFLRINTQRLIYLAGLDGHDVDPATPYGPMLAFGWKQSGLDPSVAEKAWAQFERDLLALRDTVRSAGKPLVVSYAPARFTAFDTAFDNEKCVPRNRLTIDPAARIKDICTRAGIDYVDCIPAIRQMRQTTAEQTGHTPPMYIQFDFTHLDSDGHRAIAQTLTPQIASVAKANSR